MSAAFVLTLCLFAKGSWLTISAASADLTYDCSLVSENAVERLSAW